MYQYLTPQALAIWIMDDGGYAKPGVRIATYNFTYQEHQRIVDALSLLYGLNCTILKLDSRYCIYIKASSLLQKLIAPYMHESMK